MSSHLRVPWTRTHLAARERSASEHRTRAFNPRRAGVTALPRDTSASSPVGLPAGRAAMRQPAVLAARSEPCLVNGGPSAACLPRLWTYDLSWWLSPGSRGRLPFPAVVSTTFGRGLLASARVAPQRWTPVHTPISGTAVDRRRSCACAPAGAVSRVRPRGRQSWSVVRPAPAASSRARVEVLCWVPPCSAGSLARLVPPPHQAADRRFTHKWG